MPSAGYLMIKGAVPGSKGGFVLVKDAAKRAAPEGLPFPAAVRGAPAQRPKRRQENRHEETRRAQSRQSGGRRYRARRRGVRVADPARHPRPRRQLAARQAPRRHAQGQGHQRYSGHDQKALQAKGHRPRPPGQPALAAVSRRRPDLRSGRAQPRLRPAKEGAPARPEDRAVGETGEGKLVVIDAARSDEAKTKALRPGSRRLAGIRC